MKQFLYFEEVDGGMRQHMVSSADELSCLYGWMHESCIADDMNLSEWMTDAEVGEYMDHRLGVMVRLRDCNGGKVVAVRVEDTK